MTISSEVRKAGPFAGNGSTTEFPFTFKVFADVDVVAVFTDADGIESTLTMGTDYTVTMNSDQDASPGGSVDLPAALATGDKLTLTSDIQALQTTDLTNQGGFYPQVITRSLDRLTIIAQQLNEKVGRAVVTPISSDQSGQQYLDSLVDSIGDQASNAAVTQVQSSIEFLDSRVDVAEEQIRNIAGSFNMRGPWTTATAYSAGTIGSLTDRRDVLLGPDGQGYVVLVSHTSGVFATDVAAGRLLNTDAAQLAMDLATVGSAKGAAMVAVDDGESGARFANMQEFVERVGRTGREVNVLAKCSVLQFTAVIGAGGVDVSAAVADALDELLAMGGGTLYFPPGNYLMSSRVSRAVSVPVCIRGGGMTATRIYSNQANGFFDFDYTADGDRNDGVVLQDFTFVALIPDAGTAFKMTEALGGNRHERMFAAVNVQAIQDDPTANYFTKAFDLYGVWRPFFNNVMVTGPYTSPTNKQAQAIGIQVDECYSPEFSATQVWNCNEGISYDSTSSPGPEGFWMNNGSKVVDCNVCISVSSTGTEPSMTVANSHINGLVAGIRINKWKYIRLSNNLFYANSTAATFVSATDVVGLRSTNNQYHFPSLDANTNTGISILGTSSDIVSDGDWFNRMGTAAIRISSGSSDIQVINPKFAGCTVDVLDLSNTCVLVEPGKTTSFGDGSVSGPDLEVFRDSASPATNDVLGRHVFTGRNDAGAKVEYAALRSQILDPVASSEDGQLGIFVLIGGVLTRVGEWRQGMLVGAAPAGLDKGPGTINMAGNGALFLAFNGGPGVYGGAGTPEGVVTAAIGSTYHRTDGGAGTSFYVKQSGTGNTGWAGK
jgi:hypothetical protein